MILRFMFLNLKYCQRDLNLIFITHFILKHFKVIHFQFRKDSPVSPLDVLLR